MDKSIYCMTMSFYNFQEIVSYFPLFNVFLLNFILFEEEIARADMKGQKMNGIKMHDVKE